ncbi:MAG: HemK2/MTQ2 family protein methyltransferase [Methanobacteriota archaeon]
MRRDPKISIETADGVYGPAEDSTLLIESADPKPGHRVLEVGTGSGIAALHCAAAGACVIATDRNPDAARCALGNARANGLDRERDFSVLVCDLAGALRGPFDLVIFNPPYLPGRVGQLAADGGTGGIEVVSRLLQDLSRLLSPEGKCIIVMSSHSDMELLMRHFPSLAFQRLRAKELFFEVLTSYEIRVTKK